MAIASIEQASVRYLVDDVDRAVDLTASTSSSCSNPPAVRPQRGT